jgi:4-hydroxybenzoate polyprenyltransferase
VLTKRPDATLKRRSYSPHETLPHNATPLTGATRTHSRRVLLGVSATTYLALCVWLGPQVATALIFVAGVGTLWWLACRRWPWFAMFSLGFMRGLFQR